MGEGNVPNKDADSLPTSPAQSQESLFLKCESNGALKTMRVPKVIGDVLSVSEQWESVLQVQAVTRSSTSLSQLLPGLLYQGHFFFSWPLGPGACYATHLGRQL